MAPLCARIPAVWPRALAAVALAAVAACTAWGEVRAVRWREDVDLVARTVTVQQQIRQGQIGPPKGRRRRTIPMTEMLDAALRGLDVVRTGLVVRNVDGTARTESQGRDGLHRICRRAGLPERGWHALSARGPTANLAATPSSTTQEDSDMADNKRTEDEPVPGDIIRRTTTTITEEYVPTIDEDDLDDASDERDEPAEPPPARRRR